jgi:ABC-type transporter Mla subunit MlaD
MVEQVQEFVTSLTHDWTRTLASVNTLVDSLTRTASTANRLAGTTQEMLPRVTASLEQRLATADSLMRELRAITPHAVASMDSAQAIISDTRRLVASVDRSLEARDPQIGRVLANLDTTTAVLNHFVREVTRRPGRLVSGVQPPLRFDRDEVRREKESREGCSGRGPCTAAVDTNAAPAKAP